jgi:hypothetical protein
MILLLWENSSEYKFSKMASDVCFDLSLTLELLGASYMMGLWDMPKMAATGCRASSSDMNNMEAVVVVMAATPFVHEHFAWSTSYWLRVS